MVHGREGETAAAPKLDEHSEGVDSGGSVDGGENSATGSTLPRSRTWAELMARAFLFDVLECPRCHVRMRFVATIEEPRVVAKILKHLGLPNDVPRPRPALSPPGEQGDLHYVLDP